MRLWSSLCVNSNDTWTHVSRTDLRARVNGDLQLEFADVAVTSHAGLELFRQYLSRDGSTRRSVPRLAGTAGWGDFGAVAMVRLLIGLLVVGGRRLRHLAFVQDDPLFQRFWAVQVMPTRAPSLGGGRGSR